MKHIELFESFSDNFQRWFGKSQVVDEHGKPRVVYHGTSHDFDSFDVDQKGKNFDVSSLGIYFTNFPKADNDRGWYYGSNASEWAENAGETPHVLPVHLKIENPMYINANGWYSAAAALDKQRGDIKRWLENSTTKHDGIICEYKDKDESGEIVFVVFNPNQIKSATGNNGTYSDSSNITEGLD